MDRIRNQETDPGRFQKQALRLLHEINIDWIIVLTMLDFYKWEEHIAAQVLERVKVVEGHTSKMFWVPGARIDGVEVAHHVEDRLEL